MYICTGLGARDAFHTGIYNVQNAKESSIAVSISVVDPCNNFKSVFSLTTLDFLMKLQSVSAEKYLIGTDLLRRC